MMRDASNCKAKNTFRKSGESEEDAMTRFFKEKFFGASSSSSTRSQASWCTVIVDEAHFLKNPLTYWGIGTTLLGCNAQLLPAFELIAAVRLVHSFEFGARHTVVGDKLY